LGWTTCKIFWLVCKKSIFISKEMNIALRPSGGRGEYELAGTQGDLYISDLFGLPIFIEILPAVVVNAYCKCLFKAGKSRLRLADSNIRNSHPASIIASAMMLPKPRRKRQDTHGKNLLKWEQFVVQTVRIDVVRQANRVIVRPVTVRLENADAVRLDISFAERMARVVRVWTAAATATDKLAEAVRWHAKIFTAASSTQSQLANVTTMLHAALDKPEGDMLPLLEIHFKLSAATAPSVGDMSAEISDEDFEEEIHINPAEARIERVRQWRLSAVRGHSASSFRSKVREAYDSRCLFSGLRLPRTEATATTGVDAAHILPWSRFDLDGTKNGLCLSKQNHWAFDAGLFRLSFDKAENVYVISIPETVRAATKKVDFDLKPFDTLVGPIPQKNLPANEGLWPSPKYLEELNGFLDGKTD
jgi:hypothetical protein